MIKIRPHHLLCMNLFSGKGYSDEFVYNMGRIIDRLSSGRALNITLVSGNDEICARCPNLAADGICRLGDGDVLRRDRDVLAILSLQDGGVYPYGDIIGKIKRSITRETFNACCVSCRWHKSGLCSYDILAARLSGLNADEHDIT